ncbi:formyltetrahydrofolate deformylase [Rarobacter faecitabidus]|uniref:Formyltetrahydrofolate deformylase n=1 Tax=Rarobacter faecitabidus TaxID=13243 RepID=A0A542ZXB0_RARFA|nr:formyltetrahydrofolate deformylase [Rarobacter faecitabidus]TQL64993.1 formyltetrahydrofolate deformylase [Rarobacter faecitabidus]
MPTPTKEPTKDKWVLTLSCPDRPGIVHAVTGVLAASGGNITESQQFGDPLTNTFFMRVEVESDSDANLIATSLTPVADEFELSWRLDAADRRVRTIIMVSKAAHCLNDLLFRQRAGDLPIDVAAIVSNHTDLRALAEFYDIPFIHIPVSADTKDEAERKLVELVNALDVELVVLARYMQILSDELCAELRGRVINIHHSFLPSFKGARPYHQAHQRGVKLIGATSHYVTGDLDEGPIIEQDVERVDHSRTADQLVALGQDVERRVLARAVRWHAEHRVLLNGRSTVVFR